jgi:hypothetical protein
MWLQTEVCPLRGRAAALSTAVFLIAFMIGDPASADGHDADGHDAPVEKGDVTITIAAWLWEGAFGDGFLTASNWFSGFPWLNPPTVFPVYVGPVVQYVNGIPIDPFIPGGSMPVLASDFTSPHFTLAGSDNPVSLTISGATYTVVDYAYVGSSPHPDYTPTGPQVPAVLRLEGGGVAGDLFVGVDVIGQLEVAGSSHVDELHLASDPGSLAIVEIECGGSLDVGGSLIIGAGTVLYDSCGRIEIPQGSLLTLPGGTASLGEIVLESTSASSGFTFDSDLTLQGDATFTMAGDPDGYRHIGAFTAAQLIVPPGSTLTVRDGLGYLMDDLAFQGQLRVTGGATLETDQVTLDGGGAAESAAGVLQIEDGSILRLGNISRLRGGVVETQGSGELRGSPWSGGGSISVIEDSTLNGRVRLASQEGIALGGTVRLDGSIVLDGQDSGASLLLDSETTLEGHGTIQLVDGSSSYNVIGFFTGHTLTIAPQQSLTIRGGSGYLMDDVAFQGQLRVTGGATLETDQVTLDGGGAAESAAGVLQIEDGSILRLGNISRLRGGVVETQGTGELRGAPGSGSSVSVIEDATLNGRVRIGQQENLGVSGEILLDGQLVLEGGTNSATLDLPSATLIDGKGAVACLGEGWNGITGEPLGIGPDLRFEGNCHVYASLDNGGVLAPGDGVGTMELNAPASLLASSVLEIEIDEAVADLLSSVSGDSLTLGGGLRPIATPNARATLQPDDEIRVVEVNPAGSLTGQFANVAPGERVVGPNCESFRVDYGPGADDPLAVVLTDFLLLDCQVFRDGFESGDVSAWSG